MFTPLANYLSEKLDRQVSLSLSKNFSSFWQGVKNNKYDLVHYNQLHYIKSHREYGYNVILKNEEFNQSTLTGAIFVRKDSGIDSLDDLKGKKIIFGGGQQAMISTIVPRLLLLQHGLTLDDYQMLFAKNPPNAVLATFSEDADAAGAGGKVLQMGLIKNSIDTSELKILATSKPLAHLPWAVKKDMPMLTQTKIQSLLSDLIKSAKGKKILKTAALTNLLKAKDRDYQDHREIIKQVLGQSF